MSSAPAGDAGAISVDASLASAEPAKVSAGSATGFAIVSSTKGHYEIGLENNFKDITNGLKDILVCLIIENVKTMGS